MPIRLRNQRPRKGDTKGPCEIPQDKEIDRQNRKKGQKKTYPLSIVHNSPLTRFKGGLEQADSFEQ